MKLIGKYETSKVDKIFANHCYPRPFSFNQSVAAVFDNMAERSIPLYKEVVRHAAIWAKKYCHPQDLLYDVGCSTGESIRAISDNLSNPPNIIGIDPSDHMIQAAKKKCAHQKIRFINKSALDIEFNSSAMIICNYTLQFIPVRQRVELLKKFYKSLKDKNGVLFLSEKVHTSDSEFFETMRSTYEDFKINNGYSQNEIERKKEALDQVLVPLELGEYKSKLKQAGFKKIEILLKWNQFITFIAR